MSETQRRHRSWSQAHVEQVISVMLRTGVLLSAVVVFVGGVFYLFHHGREVPAYREFHGEPRELRHLESIVAGAATGNALGVMQFGLLLLIATPVARVAFTVWAFIQQRDRLYVGITLLVLAILGVSLLGTF